MKPNEILAMIAKHGLRRATQSDLQAFGGIEGDGWICEPARGREDGEFLIVIGADETGAQIEAFGAEGEQIAQLQVTIA